MSKIKESSGLSNDIARNKRIVVYILEQYQVEGYYDMPCVVRQFVDRL